MQWRPNSPINDADREMIGRLEAAYGPTKKMPVVETHDASTPGARAATFVLSLARRLLFIAFVLIALLDGFLVVATPQGHDAYDAGAAEVTVAAGYVAGAVDGLFNMAQLASLGPRCIESQDQLAQAADAVATRDSVTRRVVLERLEQKLAAGGGAKVACIALIGRK